MADRLAQGVKPPLPPSVVRDPSLKEAGSLKIDWVMAHMPVLAGVVAAAQEQGHQAPLAGLRVAACLHLEAKTARLLLALRDLGAEVVACGSNPLSTQDDVVAALAAQPGVTVFAWHGASADEYTSFLRSVAVTAPDIVVDDGADLISMLHTEFPSFARSVLGGAEETTTGVIRLRAMQADGTLTFPVFAVNDTPMKRIFDNKYGTGQSVWDGILRTTNLTIAGRTVVVVGYGFCGKGVAMRADGLGAKVVVVEVDPVAANEALMDGFAVLPMGQAASLGDIFITVTGCCRAIRGEHMDLMKDGAILANAGHFNVEVDLVDLAAQCDPAAGCPKRVRPNIDEYQTRDGRRLYLLAEGRLVNLAAGDGHPSEVMDLSFALQAMAVLHIAAGGVDGIGAEVLAVPAAIDRQVAQLRLASIAVAIDQLTPEQQAYLAKWQV